MFDTLKKLATGSRPATSTELRDALAGIGDAEFALAVDNAEAARSDALISGDEKIVEKTETALATARRDLDRARAAKEALAAKIVEAERREAADAIEAERSEIEALANAVAKDLAKIYPRASREISSVLERLVEAERRVASFNSRIANQDLSPIDSVELRALPLHPDLSNQYPAVHSIVDRTSLRPVPGAPGWGIARSDYERAGIVFR